MYFNLISCNKRSTQTQRLLHLSQNANTCMLKLTNKLETARMVLQMTELSRKLETEQEKIMPFKSDKATNKQKKQGSNANKIDDYNEEKEERLEDEEDENLPAATIKANQNINILQSSVFNSEEDFVPPADRLANFYVKYNKILLECIAIDKEKERLAAENAQIEDLIQQYLEGMKLSESSLQSDNPLFVVNGRYYSFFI